jgi:class 3 adenylate cyclase
MEIRTEVGEPIPATAVVVDLRGFTAELNRSSDDDGSRARFCGFLAEMNAAVLAASELALEPALRDAIDDHVHVGATGDGALLVFTHPVRHVRHGVVAALILRRALERDCRRYGMGPGGDIDFGIGIETGHVRTVGAFGHRPFATYIGTCINVAARVQDLTKTIDRTHVVFGSAVIEGLLQEVFPEEHADLAAPRSGAMDDEAYLANERRRIALNRRVCVTFLHMHKLRGFHRARQLYRLSRSSGVLGNPRFDELIRRLVDDDPAWLDALRAELA